MADRVCIFVDGENFRHPIVNLFPNFQRAEYLPKSADWTSLFDWMVSQVAVNGVRIRTYWYVTESVDFYPYRFPSADDRPETLRRLLSRYAPFKERLESLDEDSLILDMKWIVEELKGRESRMTTRANGWRTVQNGIVQRHDAVEFRRAGAITYNLFEERLQREKAVDVKLATDLIMLRDIYDVAIIVSGDQDYVPAVQVVKDSGKKVINVAFLTRNGRVLPGGARRLNQMTDRSISVRQQDLGPHLGL